MSEMHFSIVQNSLADISTFENAETTLMPSLNLAKKGELSWRLVLMT